MDNLFLTRTLTAAINAMRPASTVIYDRLFRKHEHMEPTDRLAFDVITGSESILANLSVYAPATIGNKTGRRTVTLQAPRLAEKRLINAAELNAVRAFGSQLSVQLMKTMLNRELTDMRAKFDRTLEFWASRALRGIIYDADMSTQLINFGLDSDHTVTLSGVDLWTAPTTANPINNVRDWNRLIESDSGHNVTSWHAYIGWQAMDKMLMIHSVRDLITYSKGLEVLETGRIITIAGVTLEEYNKTFVDASGATQYFIAPNEVVLVGDGDDVFDTPYAPVIDSAAPNGVGNVSSSGRSQMFFAKSWQVEDPSGTWIKCEGRPCPVVQRPDAVVRASVMTLV